jgi:predicted molibdopterin-dependent oxidoreductase YjgC
MGLEETECLHGAMDDGVVKNIFIFGEDPVGCAIDRAKIEKVLAGISFTVVMDYFLTETARAADLILPASLPVETGGTFTNSQKVIQEFDKVMASRVEQTSLQQIKGILHEFGINSPENPKDIFMEVIALLPQTKEHNKLLMHPTKGDNNKRNFNYGCDAVTKRFEDLKS